MNKLSFNFILICINLIFLLLPGCTQKAAPLDDATKLALAQLSQQSIGAAGSLGLDIRVDDRLIQRGCETRMGNLGADAFAWKAGADIGLIASGTIREDFGGPTIFPKGTVVTSDTFSKTIPFGNTIMKIKLNGYRLKQVLESGASKLNAQGKRGTEDWDSDGAQHGNCWLTQNLSGAGRFFQISSRLAIEINPNGNDQLKSGTSTNNSLLVTREGTRITRISFDGVPIYYSSSGDISSGWYPGASSCTVKGVSFTSSTACSFYVVAADSNQVSGSDTNPSLSSSMLEVNNDGTVTTLNANTGIDRDAVSGYVQTFTTGPIFPKISNRIIIP